MYALFAFKNNFHGTSLYVGEVMIHACASKQKPQVKHHKLFKPILHSTVKLRRIVATK